MNKNELKRSRKELVNMMHTLRGLQEDRKTKIINNTGEKYNKEIDKMLMNIVEANMEYSFETCTVNQVDKDSVDGLVNDLKKMKKK